MADSSLAPNTPGSTDPHLQGIHTLLSELSAGQQKIIARLDYLTETCTTARAPPDVPACPSFPSQPERQLSMIVPVPVTAVHLPPLGSTPSGVGAFPPPTPRLQAYVNARGGGRVRSSTLRRSSNVSALSIPPSVSSVFTQNLVAAPTGISLSLTNSEIRRSGAPRVIASAVSTTSSSTTSTTTTTKVPSVIIPPPSPAAAVHIPAPLSPPETGNDVRDEEKAELKAIISPPESASEAEKPLPEMAAQNQAEESQPEKQAAAVKIILRSLAAPDPLVVYSDAPRREVLHGILVVLACLEFITISSTFVHCEPTAHGGYLTLLFLATSLLLLAETALNFFTAQPHNKWEINENRQLIRRRYLRTWFGWDLVMAFPLDLLALAALHNPIADELCLRTHVSAFGVLSLIRMFHIVRIPFYFRRRNPIMDMPRWVNAIFFLAVSTLVIHSFAVVWMLAASKTEQGIEAPEKEGNFVLQYVAAFNWSFQTFVHGKSDVYAKYSSTMIYSMVVKIFGFLVVTTMEAKLAEFFVNHDPFHVWARQRRQQLASMISANDVTWDIQKSIMGIYPTLLQANVRQFYNVMQDLPPFLSTKINECMKIKLISSVPMFASLGTDCQAALANVLVPELIPPETDVVRKGDAATSMFFIEQGAVDVVIENGDGVETVLTTLREGSWFGEIALLQDTTRTATVRATTVVAAYRLDKQDFNQIASEHPMLRDRLEALAAQRMSRINSARTKRGSSSIKSPSQTQLRGPFMDSNDSSGFSPLVLPSDTESQHISRRSPLASTQLTHLVENPLVTPPTPTGSKKFRSGSSLLIPPMARNLSLSNPSANPLSTSFSSAEQLHPDGFDSTVPSSLAIRNMTSCSIVERQESI